MGIEYYLVKEGSKELFELGKSTGWGQIFDRAGYTGGYPTDSFVMEELFGKAPTDIFLELLFRFVAPSFSDDTTLGYFRSLAQNILEWAKQDPLVFTSDIASNWGNIRNYPVTGSRYRNKPISAPQLRSYRGLLIQ